MAYLESVLDVWFKMFILERLTKLIMDESFE